MESTQQVGSMDATTFSPVVWRGYYVMVLSIKFFDGTVFWVGK